MKGKFFAASAAAFVLGAALAFGDTVLHIERVASKVNSGFKERVYINGRNVLTLANGESGSVTVGNGTHTIYAELYTLKTEPVSFNASGGTVTIYISADTLDNFAISFDGASVVAPPPRVAVTPAPPARAAITPAPAAPKKAPAKAKSGGVEGSLESAAAKIEEKITTNQKIAIVYVTAEDSNVADFIANELEFIMVDDGYFLSDRSQLDQIRKEQNFQISGAVDDRQAVSLGKMAGARIIITGAVTGTGDLRRLRLRAIDTQTAQVIVTASEKF